MLKPENAADRGIDHDGNKIDYNDHYHDDGDDYDYDK